MKKQYMWYLIYGIGAYFAYSYILPSIAEARMKQGPKPQQQGG